jgi:recombination protein RecR
MNIIEQLTESLRCLPGVGPKTAQRLVYYFLKNHRKQALILAKHLDEAMNTVVQCDICNNFATSNICSICQNPNRNRDLLCIVEQPTDLLAIEQSHTFNGYYFILTGKISPIDGIGIDDIGLDKLEHYLQQECVKEVIVALTPSLETQATLQYIQNIIAKHSIKLSQLAQGVPTGSELQFLDPMTISTAMRNRHLLEN